MSVKWISPVSSSSSLTRQQRAQPSHRLSHSARGHLLERLGFQNGGAPRVRSICLDPASAAAGAAAPIGLRRRPLRRASAAARQVVQIATDRATASPRASATESEGGVSGIRRISRGRGGRRRAALLAFDAFIDSSMFAAGARALGDRSTAIAALLGPAACCPASRRSLVDLACEGLKLGFGGLLVALTLALPAFPRDRATRTGSSARISP